MPTKTIKYLNLTPHLGRKIKVNKTAIIIGNTFISDCTTLRKNVIIRGDGKSINIGKNCLLKDRVTVHVAATLKGTIIGDGCMIDEYSVIHACELKNEVIVGSKSVIMDGSIIENNVVIACNTLVPPGKYFPAFSLIGGSPAKVIKKISTDEYLLFKSDFTTKQNLSIFKNSFSYKNFIKHDYSTKRNIQTGEYSFIADDAQITQEVLMGKYSSIWYSVIIFSSKKNGVISLGDGSNIQDNCIINSLGEIIKIGERVTIGHNVIIRGKSTIKNDAVIGMGSILEHNCIVGNNSFVGANSYVKSGTIIPDNTIYAGNPAAFFRKVNDKESLFFKRGQKIYEKLAMEYLSLKEK